MLLFVLICALNVVLTTYTNIVIATICNPNTDTSVGPTFIIDINHTFPATIISILPLHQNQCYYKTKVTIPFLLL